MLDAEIAISVPVAQNPNGVMDERYDIKFVGFVIDCFWPGKLLKRRT